MGFVKVDLLILRFNPVNTFPGPTSRNLVVPYEIIFSIVSDHNTGCSNWRSKFDLISDLSVVGCAVTF